MNGGWPKGVRVGAGLLALLLLSAWAFRYATLGASLPKTGAVGGLAVRFHPLAIVGLVLEAALFVLIVVRGRAAPIARWAPVLLGGALFLIGASLNLPFGHLLVLLGAALVGALTLVVALSDLWRDLPLQLSKWAPPGWPPPRWAMGVFLWMVCAAANSLFSMHRHWAFGSGSWDLGCMVHNFYRASRGLDTVSTVLGDVDFLGDHFMVGIYLFSPLFWLDSSAWMVLLVQSASLAVTAPAIYGIALSKGAAHPVAIALGLATGLAFGLQSAAFFDAHAITVGFGLLAGGLWAIENERLGLATVFLVLLATFKESLPAYVLALGLLLFWRGVREGSRRKLSFGFGWVAFGFAAFVLVNRVFMPLLIERANPPEPHETFGDFGPTVFSALLGMASDPLKALGAIFVPEEKVLSLAVTLAGTGGLALLAPEIGIASLPLLAERFLSSKATMWQMGYHYAAPLTLYAGWAAALAAPRAERVLRKVLVAFGCDSSRSAGRALALYIVFALLVTNSFGYRHPANFHRWNESYFSRGPKREANARAVNLVRSMGRSVKVAAQNRLLPHLADRPGIWRLGQYARADVVVLSLDESAWPYSNNFPRDLSRRFEASSEWRAIFQEARTVVYVRRGVALPPTKQGSTPRRRGPRG